MAISVRINKPTLPQWVHDIYDAMDESEREANVKANIYGICHQQSDGEYEITPMISALSNRVKILPDIKSVIIALSLADTMYPHSYLPGSQTKNYKCKHCECEFETHEKDPPCKSCKKYTWESDSEDGCGDFVSKN